MIKEFKIIKLEKMFFIDDPGKLCQLPYPGHPKGCPNYGRSENWYENRPGCPPNAQRIDERYNLQCDNFFVVCIFDLKSQKDKMKLLHPQWTERQCANLLYWQNGVRKELEKQCECFEIKLFLEGEGEYEYKLIPEAMGLNVFKTAEYHGIPIQRNPQNIVYKIAFMGKR